MSGKWIVAVLAVVLAVGSSAALAATEQDVTLTVTIRSLGVSVSPASYGFGIMNAGDTAVSSSPLVVTNEGNDAEDIGIRIKTEDNWGEWSSGTAAAQDTYVLSSQLASAAGGWDANDILTTSVQWCDGTILGGGGNDMAAAATVNQWFQFAAPTSLSAQAHAEDQHTITVEVSCRLAE